MGLRAGLDTETRGKTLCLDRGSNPVVQSVVRKSLVVITVMHRHFVLWVGVLLLHSGLTGSAII
jgi:hypothetical protein